MKSKKSPKQRKILVILSNRFYPTRKARYVELDCDDKGNIHQESPLRSQPREARFDEVWESDEGKTALSSCYRLKRKYRHKLEKRAV